MRCCPARPPLAINSSCLTHSVHKHSHDISKNLTRQYINSLGPDNLSQHIKYYLPRAHQPCCSRPEQMHTLQQAWSSLIPVGAPSHCTTALQLHWPILNTNLSQWRKQEREVSLSDGFQECFQSKTPKLYQPTDLTGYVISTFTTFWH